MGGAIAYNLFLVMDCVDGNIARLMKTSSKEGEFLDAVAGDLVGMLIVPCIGLGVLLRATDCIPASLGTEGGLLILVLGITSALFHQSTVLLFQRRKSIMSDETVKRPTGLSKNGQPLLRRTLLLGRNLVGFPFLAPAILAFVVFDRLWVIVCYACLTNVLLFGSSVLFFFFRFCNPRADGEASPQQAAQLGRQGKE